MGSRAGWRFNVHSVEGSEVAPTEGNPAFYTGNGSMVTLGHWGEEEEQWTWAGWVRITAPTGTWPTNFLVVRDAQTWGFELRIGFDTGRPRAIFSFLTSERKESAWRDFNLVGDESIPPGRWVHLAISTDRIFRRLLVNGVPVKDERGYLDKSISLANLRLTSHTYDPKQKTGLPDKCEVQQDDVVLFDRVMPPEELVALAARGRGGWAPELERPVRAARAWRWGWPAALFALAVLLGMRMLPRTQNWVVQGLAVLMQPAYRAVRWTLAIGILGSALIAGAIATQGRHDDEQRFAEMLERFKQDTATHWVKINDLLVRARDWISVQTNLNQTTWETWLGGNYYLHRYDGLIGIGFAQQVLPAQLAAHEAEWSARHGFDYQVRPPPTVPRQGVVELAGDPRLPVVLYWPRALERHQWFTNHSILGRDLLFQSPDDRRSWAEARRVEEVAARNEVQTSSLEEIAPAGWYGLPIQGVRLYVPWTLRTKAVYRDALEAPAWRGVMFASVDVERWLRDRFGANASPMGFRLYTGMNGGERFDLVADSANFLPATADRHNAYLRRSLEIPFYYRRLFLDAWTTEAFDAHSIRRWSWGGGAAGVAFTLLTVTLLFVQIRAREAQARVLEALRGANSELLLAYRERERLSRDLHDGSIQNLYGLGLHLQRVQSVLAVSPDRARAELNDSLALLDQSIAELRQFILTAGVGSLQQHTVASALEALVERLRKTTQIDLQLQLDEQTATLDPRAGVQVLNIVREAVSNAMRHAEARHIKVRLERTGSFNGEAPFRWVVSVTDDGRGFDRTSVNGHGSGLTNLMARATELGGRSDIASKPGEGTRVVVEFSTSAASPGAINCVTSPANHTLSLHPSPRSAESVTQATDPS